MEKNKANYKDLKDLIEILREIKIILEKLKRKSNRNGNDNLSYFI